MQCCTLPDRGVGHVKSKPSKGHKKKVTALGKAVKACKGKHGTVYKKCVKKKMK